MMKVFISHKKEDSFTASVMIAELRRLGVDSYLDVLEPTILQDGEALTKHIQSKL